MRRAALAAFVALVLAPAATAATTTPTAPVYDSKGRLVQTPYPPPNSARLTKKKASDIFLHNHEVAHWLKHYPSVVTYDASYSPKDRSWTVHVWSGNAGEVARGKVDDANGEVTEALTGPQVAWGMARGGPGAFGGEKINSKPIWLAFCAVFLLGLADLRRLASLRNLDLLVFLSFTFSLWYFNRGDIFTSVPLAYPPLVFAWAAYPFTQYVSNSNTNDSILPAFLIFGFLFVASPVKRGIFCALSAWTKFAPLIVAPLWLTYPDWRQIRPQVRFAVGFVVATLVAFSILLLEPHPLHALGTFWRHTFKSQIDRESPFSLWDWRQ